MIAKSKKSYNIGEELILPTAIKMSAIVEGKKEAYQMRKISINVTNVYFALFINLNVKGSGKLQKFERGRERKSLGSPCVMYNKISSHI